MGLIAGNVFGLAAAVTVKGMTILQQADQNASGGDFTSGAWRTRVLTSLYGDWDGICSLASSQFTLIAGNYMIVWSAPALKVNGHQTRLFDVTGNTQVVMGSSEVAIASQTVVSRSIGSAHVTPTADNTYRIEHRCITTRLADGFGLATNIGTVEIYTIVQILKLG